MVTFHGIVRGFDSKRWIEDFKTEFTLTLESGKSLTCSSPKRVEDFPPEDGKPLRVTGEWIGDSAARLFSVASYDRPD